MRARRKWGIGVAILSLLTVAVAGCGGSSEGASGKKTQISVLGWEGYADPSFIKDFEAKYNVEVSATYAGSTDEIIAKMKGGGGSVYDLIIASSDVAKALNDSNLLDSINLEHINNYKDIAEPLKQVNTKKADGSLYGIPMAWGPNTLIYDADVVKEEPTSWSVLWDPQYKGKVAVWDEISTLYISAQKDGIGSIDSAKPDELYSMTPEQLQKVKADMLALKPNIRKYWATGGELNDLYANKEIVISNGWPLTTHTLQKMGRNIKETIPKEGTSGWIDLLMITKDSPNKEMAEKLLDFLISPETLKKFNDVTNYYVSNPLAAKFMDADQMKRNMLDNPDTYNQMMKKINFWQFVPDRNRYNEVWNEVKAGQ
ncbi:UNVERIFIED_CONTAM: spermidine/putrescine-binding protein [Brevibacillus sp. OAP136]